MPELRWDPLGRRPVIVAPERARRSPPPLPPTPPDPAPCDFCPGREDRTPPATLQVPSHGPWLVRAFPNRFPFAPFHEVVVHTPGHDARFEELPPTAREAVVAAYQQRSGAAGERAVVVLFNRGRQAGASRTHEHGQVVGLDQPPPVLRAEAEAFSETPCVACRLRDEAPWVAQAGPVTTVAHPAPAVAHELLLLPPCAPHFTGAEPGPVAEALADALRRLRLALGDGLATNVVVHTAPEGVPAFHWHLHVMPRTAVWGGLELGAGLPVVAADPASTAQLLRR